MNDKSLPESIEVENAVLCDLLTKHGTCLEDIQNITSDHFSNRSNRIIFDCIHSMLSNNEKVDLVTVTSKLKDLLLLETVGGNGYLSKLSVTLCSFSALQYFSILDEKRKLRSLISLGDRVSTNSYNSIESKEVLNDIEETIFNLQETTSSDSQTIEVLKSVRNNIELKKSGIKFFGLKTGIYPWDEMLGGLMKARFYVIASRAGKGKTSIIEAMIYEQLVENIPVILFEKDMSLEMFMLRMACRAAKVPFTRYDLGKCTREEYLRIEDKVSFFERSPIYLYSPANLTAKDLKNIIKREKRIHGIQSVFLDHVLNLDLDGDQYREGLTKASTKIRDSVQESEIPHVILAQLNRGADGNERPTPANIKEFDALYADCDVMTMLWSPKNTNEVPLNEMLPINFLVNKNRYGAEFEEPMGFDRQYMTFKPLINI